MGNYKAVATAEFFKEALDRKTALALSLDLSGADPVLSVGAVAATTNVGYQVGIYDQRGGASDGWGALPGFAPVATTPQPVYTGTVIKIAYERGAAPKAYFVALEEIFSAATLAASRGATVELWEITNGNAPTLANIVANGTLMATFNANDYYPLSGRV